MRPGNTTSIMTDGPLLQLIRNICSRELGLPPSAPFFEMDQEEYETIDQMLVRLYREELQSQLSAGLEPSIESVVLTLCHG